MAKFGSSSKAALMTKLVLTARQNKGCSFAEDALSDFVESVGWPSEIGVRR